MAKARKGCYVNLPTPSGVQRWRIAFRPLRDNWGEVEWKKRTIWLHPNQTDACLAGTVIHEVGCHVATGLGSDKQLEDIFERAETGVVAALMKLGLLRTEED